MFLELLEIVQVTVLEVGHRFLYNVPHDAKVDAHSGLVERRREACFHGKEVVPHEDSIIT
jgi:hypothetical protein